MSELTRDFTKHNIILWIKEILLFFKSPKEYVELLSKKSSYDLIPQFVFYLALSTSCFVYHSVSSEEFEYSDLIRPAVLNYILVLPNIFNFTLSAWIATKEFYLKKTSIFLFSILLFFGSGQLLLDSLFINFENYLYKFVCSCWLTLAVSLAFFGYGYVINGKNLKALKITLVNLLLINCIVFISLRIDFDEYANNENLPEQDPIFEEYKSYASKLQFMDKIPAVRAVFVKGDSVYTTLGILNNLGDTTTMVNTPETDIYKEAIKKNILFLNEIQPSIRFKRNQFAVEKTLDYLSAIDADLNFRLADTSQLFKIKDIVLVYDNKITGEKAYNIPYVNDSIIAGQVFVREYNNSIIRVNKNSTLPYHIGQNIIRYLGETLDELIFTILIQRKEPSEVYREPFLPLYD